MTEPTRDALHTEVRLTIDDPRIQPCPTTGCWLWTLSLDRGGYGQVGKGKKAHRVVWEAHNGPIPAGMHLDHICRVRSCVNPDHLRPVTPRENVLFNSNSLTAQNSRKTTCNKCGSPYRVYQRGSKTIRDCPPCHAAYQRDRAKRTGRKPFTTAAERAAYAAATREGTDG